MDDDSDDGLVIPFTIGQPSATRTARPAAHARPKQKKTKQKKTKNKVQVPYRRPEERFKLDEEQWCEAPATGKLRTFTLEGFWGGKKTVAKPQQLAKKEEMEARQKMAEDRALEETRAAEIAHLKEGWPTIDAWLVERMAEGLSQTALPSTDQRVAIDCNLVYACAPYSGDSAREDSELMRQHGGRWNKATQRVEAPNLETCVQLFGTGKWILLEQTNTQEAHTRMHHYVRLQLERLLAFRTAAKEKAEAERLAQQLAWNRGATQEADRSLEALGERPAEAPPDWAPSEDAIRHAYTSKAYGERVGLTPMQYAWRATLLGVVSATVLEQTWLESVASQNRCR